MLPAPVRSSTLLLAFLNFWLCSARPPFMGARLQSGRFSLSKASTAEAFAMFNASGSISGCPLAESLISSSRDARTASSPLISSPRVSPKSAATGSSASPSCHKRLASISFLRSAMRRMNSSFAFSDDSASPGGVGGLSGPVRSRPAIFLFDHTLCVKYLRMISFSTTLTGRRTEYLSVIDQTRPANSCRISSRLETSRTSELDHAPDRVAAPVSAACPNAVKVSVRHSRAWPMPWLIPPKLR